MFDDGIQQRDCVFVCVWMPNHADWDKSGLLAKATQHTVMFESKQDMSGILFGCAGIIKLLHL